MTEKGLRTKMMLCNLQYKTKKKGDLGVPLGCFETNRFHVVLFSGARPEEVRV